MSFGDIFAACNVKEVGLEVDVCHFVGRMLTSAPVNQTERTEMISGS